jgi:hypothetical protein
MADVQQDLAAEPAEHALRGDVLSTAMADFCAGGWGFAPWVLERVKRDPQFAKDVGIVIVRAVAELAAEGKLDPAVLTPELAELDDSELRECVAELLRDTDDVHERVGSYKPPTSYGARLRSLPPRTISLRGHRGRGGCRPGARRTATASRSSGGGSSGDPDAGEPAGEHPRGRAAEDHVATPAGSAVPR